MLDIQKCLRKLRSSESLLHDMRFQGGDECGFVMFDDDFTPDSRGVQVGSPREIKLYDSVINTQLIERYHRNERTYYDFADIHSHPADISSYAGLFPSPDDMVSNGVSIAADSWPTSFDGNEFLLGLFDGIDSLPRLSPSLMLIWLPRWEAMIVASNDRSGPEVPVDEATFLEEAAGKYRRWHRSIDSRTGPLNQQSDATDVREMIANQLVEIPPLFEDQIAIEVGEFNLDDNGLSEVP